MIGSIEQIAGSVADWQVDSFEKTRKGDVELVWTSGAFFVGLEAWTGVSQDSNYINFLTGIGERHDWTMLVRMGRDAKDDPYKNIIHADDHASGQMYLERYLDDPQPERYESVQKHLDQVVEGYTDDLQLYWCDALFMAEPLWTMLAGITGETKYLDFMHDQWRKAYELLWDEEHHLYFRDRRFIKRRDNDKKIFWSRGNGWVMAALPLVLQDLPKSDPNRSFYVDQLTAMAASLKASQQPDGHWSASLLVPENYPEPESSGTAFFCYGLAWGINHGYLDKATYLPVVLKAWDSICSAVQSDGKMGWVQSIGAEPAPSSVDGSQPYGAGAFLLAAAELHHLVAIEKAVQTFSLENTLGEYLPHQRIQYAGDYGSEPLAVLDLSEHRYLPAKQVDTDNNGRADMIEFHTNFLVGQEKHFYVLPASEVNPR